MKPDEAEQLEFEVSSLDAATMGHARRFTAVRWLRSKPGRLALSALCVVLILGAVIGMFVRASADPIGEARIALGMLTPTPTPVIPPGGDTFGLINAAPWGDLRIDGRAPTLTTIDPIGQGFTLPRGVHHLVYQAQYFPTLRCVVSIPQSPNDTCPLSNVAVTEGLAFQRILDLLAIPNRMVGGHYDLLVSAVSAALASYTASTTIEPGERYINQHGHVETAQAAMTFTMGLKQAQEPRDPDCPFLCPMDMNEPVVTSAWLLTARVEPTWTITDAAGRSFSSSIPSAPASSYTPTQPDSVTFAVVLDGIEWKVSSQDESALNSIAQESAFEALAAQFGPTRTLNGGTTSGANPAEGAIIMMQSGASGTQTILLWRFGLLYAANTQTKRWFPSLPLASQREQALAQSMAAGMRM